MTHLIILKGGSRYRSSLIEGDFCCQPIENKEQRGPRYDIVLQSPKQEPFVGNTKLQSRDVVENWKRTKEFDLPTQSFGKKCTHPDQEEWLNEN